MTIGFITLLFVHFHLFGSRYADNSICFSILSVKMFIILCHTLNFLTISLVPKRLSFVGINGNHLLTLYIIARLENNCKRILMHFCYNYFLMKSLFYWVFSDHKRRTYVGYELHLFSFIHFCSATRTIT